MSVPISYSFKDLLLNPVFKIAAKLDDKKIMKQCFEEIGIDTSLPYEIIHCLHRTRLSNEPWEGLMVTGYERLDKEWLESSYASYEAKIHTNDPFLRETLKSLDPTKMKRDVVSDFEDDEVEVVN